MRKYLKVFLVITLIALWISCAPEPAKKAYSTSVEEVVISDLVDYSGSGSLPANKDEALEAASIGLEATGEAMGSMIDLDGLPLPSIVKALSLKKDIEAGAPMKTIIDNLDVDDETGAVSGNITITDEDMLDEYDNVIGNIESLIANIDFSGIEETSTETRMSMSMDLNADVDASMTLADFDYVDEDSLETYTITDAAINASVIADADYSMVMDISDETNPVYQMHVAYNIGAAVSAGYVLSSDEFLGKILITLNMSDRQDVTVDMMSEDPEISPADFTLTIRVYDNDDVLQGTYTYTQDDLTDIAEIPLDL